MPPAITLHDITFTYPGASQPALRAVSLDVPDGQICAVVGRTGAGKSTLCALCGGFVPHFYDGTLTGSATVAGMDVVASPVAELVRNVGLVGANAFSQISGARFTVFEEVAFGLENLGIPRAEMIERVNWALAAMQITDLRDRSPYALSGGQQQRLVIAATLALRPQVLLLDEPTAQLDTPTIAELADLLRSLAQAGTTILFAEQRLEWAAALAERVVALDAGRLIADGPPAAVLTNQLLRDCGIGWPRPALLAAQARETGHWPPTHPLPITLDGLVDGLRAGHGLMSNDPVRQQTEDGRRKTDESHSPSTVHRPPSTVHRPSSIIALEDVHFAYPSGVLALRGVSMQVGAGERVALLGRNGAGKSTLVRQLNGLLKPAQGRVLVNGTATTKLTVAQCARSVGIVFQDVRNQLFARTVRDELRFGPRNLGYAPSKIEALIDYALEMLGLRELASEHPYDLPPALRRLVATAAVTAMDPQLLVLDEPTAGLDNPSIARLAALANDMAARGKSVLVVSHDIDFCYEALERVVLMQAGQLTLDGQWHALDTAQRERLRDAVGLPLALQAELR